MPTDIPRGRTVAATSSGGGAMFRFSVGWSVVSLAALCLSLARLSLDRSGSADASAHNAAALWPFWIASAACWLGLTGVLVSLRRGVGVGAAKRHGAMVVLGVALTARLAVLITHEPSLSDDVFRYVFDGRNLAAGHNPYLTDPDARRDAINAGLPEHWRGERELVALLAYPEITTPYLPLSQYVFAGLGWVCERGGWTTPSASSRVFRVGFTVIEVGLMLTLLGALRRRAMSPWWLALYAWHPLAIDTVCASGHQDIIGVMLMAAALAALTRAGPDGPAAPSIIPFASLLSMGVMVKPIAGVAGIMGLRWWAPRAWLMSALVGAAVCFALAKPLDWRPGTPAFDAWKETAGWMAEKAAHFGGVYEPVLCGVRHAMPDGPQREPGFNLRQEWLARKICVTALTIAVFVVWWRSRDAWRATAMGLLLALLCSTICHPWYLLWAFALFPAARGGWALWTYSLTILAGYVVFISGKGHALGVEWTVAPAALLVAYIPVAIALLADMFAAMRRSPDAMDGHEPTA